ncbi:MAG: hypothetical protein KKD21_03620 [Proteobacteria bacterium]|nr:hypothetical protein [Pseudomonadota bacterium]
MDIAVTLAGLGQGLAYVILGIFFIWLVKKVDDWRTKDFDDDVHMMMGMLLLGLEGLDFISGSPLHCQGPWADLQKVFFLM